MTLKEEMQKIRDEEIARMCEEDVESTKNVIRQWFLDKQSGDKKQSDFSASICWYNDKLILNYDENANLSSTIVPEQAKEEFIESLEEKLYDEGIEMNPEKEGAAWSLIVELS